MSTQQRQNLERFVSVVALQCYKAYHKFCIEKVDDPCPNRVNTLKFVPPARDRTRRANNSRELSKEQKNRLRKIRCIEVCMEHIIKKGAKVEVEKMVLWWKRHFCGGVMYAESPLVMFYEWEELGFDCSG